MVLIVVLAAVAVSLSRTTLGNEAGPARQGRTAVDGPQTCYRLSTPAYERVDPANNATLITTDAAKASASLTAGFTQDLGEPFSVSTESGPGLVAVHELINGSNGDHLYTADPVEMTRAERNGSVDSGIAFYSLGRAAPCATAIIRMIKGGMSQYPATAGERTTLAQAGWSPASAAFSAVLNTGWAWPLTSGKGPLDQAPFLYTGSDAWHAYQKSSDPTTRRLLYQIAATPTAIWLGGSSGDQAAVDRIETEAAAEHRTPEFVLYAIPDRDCGGYAAGGLSGPGAYENWIRQIRASIGQRPAVVIVEPDAIGMSCLDPAERDARISMLRYAIATLSQDPRTWVYVHAGSSQLRPEQVIPTLIAVGVGNGRGFALNVSGYGSSPAELRYGDQIVADLAQHGVAGMHYVVDTSRNGLGRAPDGSADAAHTFCNQRGRALGQRPTPWTGNPNVDAFLWIKPPGESDGACYPGDPSSGWFQGYALDLVQRSLAQETISELGLPQ